MTDFPFRINIINNEGRPRCYFTASLVTTADTAISASAMVNKIRGMKSSSFLRIASGSNDGGLDLNHGSHRFDHYDASDPTDRANFHLSASHTGAHTGSIVFHDREASNGGGLAYYEFFGTKVCSVLGIPEGIRIRPENFRLSDSSTDTTNYLSGDIISNGVQIKESLKLSTQARMRSNLIWDEGFGEGFIQFVSGSLIQASFGFDGTTYSMFTNQITGSTVKATTFTGNLTGNVTGNVTGNASTATTLNYIGNHNTVSDPAATADQLIFSGSESSNGNGGDIVLKAGNNTGGNVLGANVTGGNIVLEPGGAGVILNNGAGSVTNGNVTAGGNIIPSTDSTYTIGGASNYWSHGYIDAITTTGDITAGGDILPAVSANKDLGSTSKRWNNIYTTDLQLSNIDKDKGNNVDGTRGDWTLQEGDENLYVINNISGKKYKIALIPMDDKDE